MFRVAWKKVENELSDNRKTKVNIRNPLRSLIRVKADIRNPLRYLLITE